MLPFLIDLIHSAQFPGDSFNLLHLSVAGSFLLLSVCVCVCVCVCVHVRVRVCVCVFHGMDIPRLFNHSSVEGHMNQVWLLQIQLLQISE